MPNEDDAGRLDDSESAVLHIISEGVKDAADEATKKHGEELLKHLLPVVVAGPLAGPLAAGVAAMVAVLIESLFKATNATERKLDRLIAEPFETATRTIKEILSEEVRNDPEEVEATRRLQHAADELEKAYTHAECEVPKKRLLVRAYQCLVAALLKGGGAAMRKHLEGFRVLAAAAREAAKHWTAAADRVKNREAGVMAEEMELYAQTSRLFAPPMHRELAFPLGLPSEQQLQSFLASREAGHREQAETMEKRAKDLDTFCALAEVVHQNRRGILCAPKHRTLLKKMWRRLFVSGQS